MKIVTAKEPPSLRFYPDYMPHFEHEPTRDRFHIGYEGDDLGEGVRSLVDFLPGDVVFALTGFFSSEVTLFSLQIAEDLHLHDPFFYGKLLHSCDPNSRADVKARLFKAIKPIAPGDFVTIDYAETEDFLFRSFPCACGAANCRKTVLGRRQTLSDEDTMVALARDAKGNRSNIVPLTKLVTAPMGLFEVLSDINRRRILLLLLDDDLRAQDLMHELETSYSIVSSQLRILRQMGLVRQYKMGRQVFYANDDERVGSMFEQARAQVTSWNDRVATRLSRNGQAHIQGRASRLRRREGFCLDDTRGASDSS